GGEAGGMLVGTRREGGIGRTVAGMGLNLLAPPVATDAAQPVDALAPTGLFDSLDAVDVDELARACALAVWVAFDDFVARGFGAFAERWRAFDAAAGRPVVLRDAEIGRASCRERVQISVGAATLTDESEEQSRREG